ncbi:hypothetical protein [Blastococcus sp. TF02-8]|uniref:hypothetical protein n=1 Tax=Blastococcus sp. TF02-8 TaxID=2250574 RepID=UPI0011BD9DE5|nr:hypothetical protein [Blastococcus sp. TF02-8]
MPHSRTKRAASVFGCFVALTAGGLATAGSAQATLSSCITTMGDNGAYARCYAGTTGEVRVIVACPTGTIAGPWVGVNRNSVVFCSNPRGAGYERRG